jgi:uncharacterized beta-barrel protein YwiB (DUF1934 family)
MTEGPSGGAPIYPNFYIKETDLPTIKDKKIDDEYKVVLKVKQKAIRKMRAGEIEAEVEVVEIGLLNKDS